MKKTTSPALAFLAFTLSTWVDGERAEYCQQWATYWQSGGEKPGKGPGLGAMRKDSDAFVYSDALACVRYGWESKAASHLARVQRRMKATPALVRFTLAAYVGAPQVRDGRV